MKSKSLGRSVPEPQFKTYSKPAARNALRIGTVLRVALAVIAIVVIVKAVIA